ncbi:N-acetyltransferase [Kribbella antibiotica]|uniref:N-acetyltransferase n=1 Tax=Kribbella antibiotica TaxID=190195 RepID=A0A4R4ZTQ2_9ACTN|nr:GNAT family N-acetyltransferase [Kribbella antibiotica]TDD62498.1 N-acetyltransferase [Kribbella antibiotica]
MPTLTTPAIASTTFAGAQPLLDNLRPWRQTDVPAVLEAFGNAEIQQWHVLRLDDEAEARGWVDQWAPRWSAAEAASWAITAAGEVAGQIGLRHISLSNATVELSYWVLPAARGQGLAPQAIATLERWCFALGFERIVLQHSTRNQQSCRVAEKAGYALEGTLRSAWRLADGRHDAHLHARTTP